MPPFGQSTTSFPPRRGFFSTDCRLFVCKTLSHNSKKCKVCPHPIIRTVGDSVVIAELELCGVAVQVLLVAVLIDALHAALEDAEIAFNRVRVDNATAILALAVRGEIVVCELAAKERVLLCLVGIDRGFLGDILAQGWAAGLPW